IGVLAVAAGVTVGVIGLTQAMASSRRADSTFVITHALAATIDAQHTASVILADTALLTTPLATTAHAELVDQLTEQADDMREHLAYLRGAKLDQRFVADVDALAPTVDALLGDVDQVARNTGEVPQPVVVAARAHWAAFDEKSDALKSALAEQSSV